MLLDVAIDTCKFCSTTLHITVDVFATRKLPTTAKTPSHSQANAKATCLTSNMALSPVRQSHISQDLYAYQVPLCDRHPSFPKQLPRSMHCCAALAYCCSSQPYATPFLLALVTLPAPPPPPVPPAPSGCNVDPPAAAAAAAASASACFLSLLHAFLCCSQ